MTEKAIKIIVIPNNPNSSPITEMMKSVSRTGRYRNWVWVPLPIPFPHMPPEPIAIMD